MISLKELLKGIEIQDVSGDFSIQINSFHYDSRKIRAGDVFIALKGSEFDGHDYIKASIERKAAAIIYEEGKPAEGATFVRVKNCRHALAILADNFFGNPSKKLSFIGITGTNGKTSTSFLTKNILDHAEIKTGLSNITARIK